MRLVNGWLLVRTDEKRGMQLGSGCVIDGEQYLGCKIIFKYTIGFSYHMNGHPDGHMLVHKDDVLCITEEPAEPPPILSQNSHGCVG